jgi:hypothetical protein
LLVSHAKELTDESLLETDKQEVTERKDSYWHPSYSNIYNQRISEAFKSNESKLQKFLRQTALSVNGVQRLFQQLRTPKVSCEAIFDEMKKSTSTHASINSYFRKSRQVVFQKAPPPSAVFDVLTT